jgi:hypothetical protein
MTSNAESTPQVETIEKVEAENQTQVEKVVAEQPAATEIPKSAPVKQGWGNKPVALKPKKSKDDEKNWPTLQEAKTKAVPAPKHVATAANGAKGDAEVTADATAKTNKKSKQRKGWEPLKGVQPKLATPNSRNLDGAAPAHSGPANSGPRKQKHNRAPKQENKETTPTVQQGEGVLDTPAQPAQVSKSNKNNVQNTLPIPKQQGSNQQSNGNVQRTNFRQFRGRKGAYGQRRGFPQGGFPQGTDTINHHYVNPDIIKDVILKQIHYYFSTDNLCKDIYLRMNMNQEGYINIEVLMPFNRLKNISSDKALILSSIAPSPILEVKDDLIRLKNDWNRWIFPLTGSDFNPNQIVSKTAEGETIKG